MTWLKESNPLSQEYSQLMKRLQQGVHTHPMEVWEVMEALREEGFSDQARRLGEYLDRCIADQG
ncbi:hypothetical protein SAMN02927924_01447 [Sphingobium faniae]|nr:hypothetical protein SAMN02927924_01447 [Sphingobium faniae]